MDFDILYAIPVVAAVLLAVIYFSKRRAVTVFLEGNTDVPELYLQKAVDNKLRTLNHALRPSINSTGIVKKSDVQLLHKELHELKESYKEQKINLKTYNNKLDLLISRLN